MSGIWSTAINRKRSFLDLRTLHPLYDNHMIMESVVGLLFLDKNIHIYSTNEMFIQLYIYSYNNNNDDEEEQEEEDGEIMESDNSSWHDSSLFLNITSNYRKTIITHSLLVCSIIACDLPKIFYI